MAPRNFLFFFDRDLEKIPTFFVLHFDRFRHSFDFVLATIIAQDICNRMKLSNVIKTNL